MTDCIVDGCTAGAFARGLCKPDYMRWWFGRLEVTPLPNKKPGGRTCSVEGCDRRYEAHGYCTTHYAYALGSGALPAGKRSKVKHGGYLMIWKPDHPNAWKTGYVAEHVAIMSDILGRPLRPGETVHHRNGVKDDNRIKNLELWSTNHGKGARVSDLLEWAWEIIHTYDPDLKVVRDDQ